MSKVQVIIIDSGVDIKDYMKEDNIKGFTWENGNIICGFQDEYGHGTAVYNIIRKTNCIADIFNIKLKGIEEGIKECELINILNYIYENIEVKVINLSLGINIIDDYNSFFDICRKLYEKGVIIVSAFDNSGAISYPAAFDNVIGVVSSEYCKTINEYIYINDSMINIGGKGSIQRLAWKSPDYILLGGNSFACAHISVQIIKYIHSGINSKDKIIKKFKESAILHYNIESQELMPPKVIQIKKAALFPFNKEMHSLIRFSDLLEFEIVGIYDSKYSGVVGATTCHLMKDTNIKNLEINNIDNINWNSFDTLIIGHLQMLDDITKKNCRFELINKAVNLKKYVYCFDDISSYLTDELKKYVVCPKIDSFNLPPNRFGKLFRISKPVLGVFGTSSKQGKFTLQLKLRNLLKKQGYNIGQIGTEASSLLFGMDYVYPMGYNNSVYIKEFDSILYLNNLLNNLCRINKDIIIVGSQSGTVPYDIGNLEQFNLPQYSFLMGTLPDAVILCINPFDDMEYIIRTINFIQAVAECKVIAISIFPLDLKDDWSGIYSGRKILDDNKFIKLRDYLFKKLKIYVFRLDNINDMNSLVSLIIDYFSDTDITKNNEFIKI